jgi:hypothetical protein
VRSFPTPQAFHFQLNFLHALLRLLQAVPQILQLLTLELLAHARFHFRFPVEADAGRSEPSSRGMAPNDKALYLV